MSNLDITFREEDVLTEFLEELLGTVMTASDASDPDRSLSAVFQLLPSRRRYPEYYKVICDCVYFYTFPSSLP